MENMDDDVHDYGAVFGNVLSSLENYENTPITLPWEREWVPGRLVHYHTPIHSAHTSYLSLSRANRDLCCVRRLLVPSCLTYNKNMQSYFFGPSRNDESEQRRYSRRSSNIDNDRVIQMEAQETPCLQ